MDSRKLYELHQKHDSRCMQARILRQRVEQAVNYKQNRRALQRIATKQQARLVEQQRQQQARAEEARKEQARLAT